MNKKEKEKFVFWKCLAITLLVVLMIMLSLSIVKYAGKSKDRQAEFDEAGRCWEIRESSMRLTNETGKPYQYNCEQIKIFMQSGVYPSYVETYECKNDCYSGEYSWCRTRTNNNRKEDFVNYYILECT